MRNEKGALHLEVLSAMPGRIRFQLEKPIKSDVPFLGIKGVTRCHYNPRIGTLLCKYDQLTATEEQLLVKIGAVYAGLVGTALLHIKHSEEEGFSMAPSGYLALCCIALDGSLTLMGSTLTRFTRWLSVGATLAAVAEHGYQELHARGSFDPEVMSVVYLINSIGKTNGPGQRAGLGADVWPPPDSAGAARTGLHGAARRKLHQPDPGEGQRRRRRRGLRGQHASARHGNDGEEGVTLEALPPVPHQEPEVLGFPTSFIALR